MAGVKSFTIFTKFAVKNGFTGPVLNMAKGADKAAQRIAAAQKVAKSMGHGLAQVGKFAAVGAGAVVAAGAAVWSLADASQKAADDIQNTAAALGMSTKTLQEYRYAGIQAGMSTEDMDAALGKLSKNLGTDSAQVDEALYQIGLSAQDLRDAGPDKTLELVANGFQSLTDPTKKAAVATALFGKSSIRMVNTLSKGAAGIKEQRDEAEKIGYVMGGDTLDNAGALNDQLDKLGATAIGLRNRLAAKAMPGLSKFVDVLQKGIQPGGQLSKIIDSLSGVMGKIGDFSSGGLSAIFDFIPKIAGFVGDVLTALKPVLDPIMKMISPLLKIFENVMPIIIKGVELVSALLAPIAEAIKFILDGIAAITSDTSGSGARGMGGMATTPQTVGSGAPRWSPAGVPMSPQTSTINSNTSTVSTVEIGVTGPPGTTAKGGPGAPPVTLNTGSNKFATPRGKGPGR